MFFAHFSLVMRRAGMRCTVSRVLFQRSRSIPRVAIEYSCDAVCDGLEIVAVASDDEA